MSRFGFFLEFDRGTEKPSEYAAKIAAYYYYRDRGAAAHEYAGFPTLLVVTTREAASSRFAHQAQVASERHAGNPLSILLTRTDVIEATRKESSGRSGVVPDVTASSTGARTGFRVDRLTDVEPLARQSSRAG